MSATALSGKRTERSLAAVVKRVRSAAASAGAGRARSGDWQVLVGIEASGLCHSDVRTRRLGQIHDAFRELGRARRARPHPYPDSEDWKGT